MSPKIKTPSLGGRLFSALSALFFNRANLLFVVDVLLKLFVRVLQGVMSAEALVIVECAVFFQPFRRGFKLDRKRN